MHLRIVYGQIHFLICRSLIWLDGFCYFRSRRTHLRSWFIRQLEATWWSHARIVENHFKEIPMQKYTFIDIISSIRSTQQPIVIYNTLFITVFLSDIQGVTVRLIYRRIVGSGGLSESKTLVAFFSERLPKWDRGHQPLRGGFFFNNLHRNPQWPKINNLRF